MYDTLNFVSDGFGKPFNLFFLGGKQFSFLNTIIFCTYVKSKMSQFEKIFARL